MADRLRVLAKKTRPSKRGAQPLEVELVSIQAPDQESRLQRAIDIVMRALAAQEAQPDDIDDADHQDAKGSL